MVANYYYYYITTNTAFYLTSYHKYGNGKQ